MERITIVYGDRGHKHTDGYFAYVLGDHEDNMQIGGSPDEAIGGVIRECLSLPGRMPCVIEDLIREEELSK